MGHVLQSTTLAKEVRAKADVSFLTKSDGIVSKVIRDAGFDVMQLESDEAILGQLQASGPDVVVFDKLDVDEDLARNIKRSVKAGLVIFTNLTSANTHADVAVIADFGTRLKNVVRTDTATGTTYYHGPRYWVLRKEFHQLSRDHKATPPVAKRILLLFGGSDPANLTSVVLDTLLSAADQSFDLDVVLGAHFGHADAVDNVLLCHSAKRARVSIHRNVKNVAELMHAADLVVASPGLSAFEALRVGTPVIVVPHDSLQRDAYQGLMQMVERHDVPLLLGMIERAQFTFPQNKDIVDMQIGEGVPELVAAILGSRR